MGEFMVISHPRARRRRELTDVWEGQLPPRMPTNENLQAGGLEPKCGARSA